MGDDNLGLGGAIDVSDSPGLDGGGGGLARSAETQGRGER